MSTRRRAARPDQPTATLTKAEIKAFEGGITFVFWLIAGWALVPTVNLLPLERLVGERLLFQLDGLAIVAITILVFAICRHQNCKAQTANT
jgi:hypothetical protein